MDLVFALQIYAGAQRYTKWLISDLIKIIFQHNRCKNTPEKASMCRRLNQLERSRLPASQCPSLAPKGGAGCSGRNQLRTHRLCTSRRYRNWSVLRGPHLDLFLPCFPHLPGPPGLLLHPLLSSCSCVSGLARRVSSRGTLCARFHPASRHQ